MRLSLRADQRYFGDGANEEISTVEENREVVIHGSESRLQHKLSNLQLPATISTKHPVRFHLQLFDASRIIVRLYLNSAKCLPLMKICTSIYRSTNQELDSKLIYFILFSFIDAALLFPAISRNSTDWCQIVIKAADDFRLTATWWP